MGTQVIVGIGELLWDLLPGGKQPGGAAANFVYHAGMLGAQGWLVSRVGNDALGHELLKRLDAIGVASDGVTLDQDSPTGTVKVDVSEEGQPCFTICENVAWDRIIANQRALEAVARADGVCFGTLAQRGEVSRTTLRALVTAARPEALKICDINLRSPFYSQPIIEDSLRLANALKINDQELPILAEMFGLAGKPVEQLAELTRRYGLRWVALTRGAHGSLIYSKGDYSEHPGFPGPVADTVGAGDSFTAALAMGWLAGWKLETINRRANEIAAYVVSQPGATPRLPEQLIAHFPKANLQKANPKLL